MRPLALALLVGCGRNADPPATSTGTTDSADGYYAQVLAWVDAYEDAHPGNDADINAKSESELASDPEAQQLLGICGPDQRPVIPRLAWEYGGNDHAWIQPNQGALVYCVYTPVQPSTEHWDWNAATQRVTADLYVLFPHHNPCGDREGAEQVSGCIGDETNFEILVDTCSLHDGNDVGLDLSEASTELMLLLADGTKTHLILNL